MRIPSVHLCHITPRPHGFGDGFYGGVMVTPRVITVVTEIRFPLVSCYLLMMVVIGGGWAVILGHFQGGIDFFVQPEVAIYQPAWGGAWVRQN